MSDHNIYFYKGAEDQISKLGKDDQAKKIKAIQEAFSKVLDGKNLSFLLGSGCSSHKIKNEDGENVETGIPTMYYLAEEFYTKILTNENKDWLKETLKLDVANPVFQYNLETFLSALHSYNYYYEVTGQEETDGRSVKEIIRKTKRFILKKCLYQKYKGKGDSELVAIYQSFYRKLLYRNTNLNKPNIFTSNYDLYSETALDKLGIHYVNGFSGGIKRYFNPTIFNYALAEKMDLSQSKWNVIDNFIYLYKIHGSVNWIQASAEPRLFNVREIQSNAYNKKAARRKVVMIHPTPLKQSASMGSPYSDLFREFQKKLMQNNNVLICLGYSFNDTHINNLIYQAFTIPSFRLIILGEPSDESEILKLKELDDPRIWIIGGILEDEEKLHYFKNFVSHILPELTNDEIDAKLENVIKKLFQND